MVPRHVIDATSLPRFGHVPVLWGGEERNNIMAFYDHFYMRNYWISDNPSAQDTIWKRVQTLRKTWQRRTRERNELARVTSRDLADIGMTSGQADFEMNKPFWKE